MLSGDGLDAPRVFFDISIAGEEAGRIVVTLFVDVVPKTVENFRRASGRAGQTILGRPRAGPFASPQYHGSIARRDAGHRRDRRRRPDSTAAALLAAASAAVPAATRCRPPVPSHRQLCTGEAGVGRKGKPLHYKGSIFHRVIPEFMCA